MARPPKSNEPLAVALWVLDELERKMLRREGAYRKKLLKWLKKQRKKKEAMDERD